MDDKKLKKLKDEAFPKGFEKRFDDFVDSLNKKQYFEFMAIDITRGSQIEYLYHKTIKDTLKKRSSS